MPDEVHPSVKVRQGRQEQQLERASMHANPLAAAYTPFTVCIDIKRMCTRLGTRVMTNLCMQHSTSAGLQLTLVVQAPQLHAADLLAALDAVVFAACIKRPSMLSQVMMGKSRAGL
jgi:hypothetical protein